MKDTLLLERRILHNQKIFLDKTARLKQPAPLAERCLKAYDAAQFAVAHTTDILSSDAIENTFLELAQSISIPLPETYAADTVLHVMTEAYTTGGHTRCVERWIALFPEHRHSCVVLRQKAPFPDALRSAVEDSGGRLIVEDPRTLMVERAKRLRVLASRFERVILHIHMDDPVALIAFGTLEFKRPIVFFNHADHAFWLGVSIADHVADLNSYRLKATLEQRRVNAASKIGIPVETKALFSLSKEEARLRLGIPQHRPIVFSAGSSTKYEPIGKPDFSDIVTDLIEDNRHLLFYIAGAEADSLFWPALKRAYPANIVMVGRVDYHTQFMPYLAASDLVVDSFPVGGGTFLIDAVRAGRPALTLNTTLQSDFVIQSMACCRSYGEFLHKARKSLKDPAFAQTLYADMYAHWKAESDPQVWREKCLAMYRALPERHGLHAFKTPPPTAEVSRCALETCRWTDPFILAPVWKRALRTFRYWLLHVRWKKDRKRIRLFGKDLFLRGYTSKKDFAA